MVRFALGYSILIGSLLLGILSEGCAKAPAGSDSSATSSSIPTTISTDAQ